MLSTLSVSQIQILCHGAALGFFLLLGQVVTRYKQPLIRRDLLVNVGTGLGILIVIKAVDDVVKLCAIHSFAVLGVFAGSSSVSVGFRTIGFYTILAASHASQSPLLLAVSSSTPLQCNA